jgi:hypothetical protein
MAGHTSIALTGESIAHTDAAITDKTPYYMCFAYTQDGMFFAGGDFSLRRAQKLMAANCNVPKSFTVVLLRTLMMRKNGKTYSYSVAERNPR